MAGNQDSEPRRDGKISTDPTIAVAPGQDEPVVDTKSYETLDPPADDGDAGSFTAGDVITGKTFLGEDGDKVDDPSNLGGLEGQLVAVRYKVLRKVGEGGMGAVYLAEHVTIQKKIALKVLLDEYAKKDNIKQRFLQEAKAAAKIGHENIVDIIDFGTTPHGSLFFAMEYLEGDDLSKVLQMAGCFHWERAKPVLLQVCRALEAAHNKGIIHRDMKPENIFLMEREGQRDFVKILDFGIAKVGLDHDQEGSRLTRTGMVFGTPHYMSPEQALGKKPDNRVDVYSVGVIMYEMLTGQVPFNGETFMAILTQHIQDKPKQPRKIREDIPAEVEGILLKAMAKKPEERFQSMAEMAVAISRVAVLTGYHTGETLAPDVNPDYATAATRMTLPDGLPKSRSWIAIAGLALLLIVASVGVIVYMGVERTPKAPPPGAVSEVPLKAQPAPAKVPPAKAPAVETKVAAAPPPVEAKPQPVAVTPDASVPKPKPKARPKRPRHVRKRRPKPKPKVEPKPKPKPKPKSPTELIDPWNQ